MSGGAIRQSSGNLGVETDGPTRASGSVLVASGAALGTDSGMIRFSTGDASSSSADSDLIIHAGGAEDTNAVGGFIAAVAGRSSNAVGGPVEARSGVGSTSGNITLLTANKCVPSTSSGKLLLATGIATVRSTGEVLARVGEAQATSAGVNCRAGHAVAGSDIVTSGSVILATGPTAASFTAGAINLTCLLYTSPSPRDGLLSRMPSSA